MSGVDLSDQLRQYYAAGRQSRKYWKCIFWFIMNLSINNAFVASKGQLDDTSKQFLFRLALAKHLIDRFSARKRQSRKREANQDDSTLAKKKKIRHRLESP
jgi:hypothetical protein